MAREVLSYDKTKKTLWITHPSRHDKYAHTETTPMDKVCRYVSCDTMYPYLNSNPKSVSHSR